MKMKPHRILTIAIAFALAQTFANMKRFMLACIALPLHMLNPTLLPRLLCADGGIMGQFVVVKP